MSKPMLAAIVALTLILNLAHSAPPAAGGADLYVAPAGDDANSATQERPLATLQAARDAIRAMRTGNALPAGGVTVWIAPGIYRLEKPLELTAADSGTKDAPIVYRAIDPGTARVIGGQIVSPAAWKPVADPAVVARLDKSAADKIVAADLRSLGIADFGPINKNALGGGAMLELFFNGQPMTLARWPNEGWATIVRVTDHGTDRNSKIGGKFIYDDARHARWAGRDDVFLHGFWTHDWADDALRIASIDPQKKEITLAERHGYGIDASNYTARGGEHLRRYFALNVLEELDSPGEYYLDRTSGVLYFYPPAAGGELAVSMLSQPMLSIRDAAHVTLRGLTLEFTRGSAVEVRGGSNVLIAGCTIRNIGGGAVQLDDGTNNGVVSCDIYATGTGGISIHGGDRRTLAPAGLFADNNHIHHFARRKKTYQAAIHLGGVGNRARHNEIHDTPHAAILYGGNENLIELNDIHHVALETGDVGALYTGRDWGTQGNVIRHNFIHHLSGHGAWSMGVYLDDCDSGDTIVGNVFYQVRRAAFIGGGRDNTVRGNIFIECEPAVHVDNRGLTRMELGTGNSWDLLKKIQQMDYRNPPWSTRYPKLVGIMDEEPLLPLGNVVTQNVAVRCPRWADWHGNEKYVTVENNFITEDDPGFVDAPRLNFQLHPDSAVFKSVPGFEPIPFAKIGLYEDEYRKEVGSPQ